MNDKISKVGQKKVIDEKRSRYRILYADNMRPRFLLNGYPYEIIEISSNGLKFSAKGEFRIQVGSKINGRIELKNGSAYDVAAKIVRSAKDGVALKLETEIPSKVIFNEERYGAKKSEEKMAQNLATSEKRAHYRVKYPIKGGSRFIFNGHQYEIIEISPNGLKFNQKGEFKIRVGLKINARVELKNGYSGDLTVKVMRMDKESVAIKLETGIPPKVIIDEERYILEHNKKK
jgi:hypothetical protein